MIKRFFILLLAIVASVGMSFAQASIVSSGTKGGMSYTFYDNGLLEISGSGALPGQAFTNWDGGFGTSVKNIRFAEDCEVYGLDYLWFGCYTENSQLETVEINSVAPIMFSGTSGAGIFYRQDGAVTITITAPGIVDVENRIIDNYGSPVNMIFNMPATTVFEKKWFSGLENYFAVTIPTGATGHIPAGYVFKDSYDQEEYDHLVADGYEDMFWNTHSNLVEGVDYTLGVESTFVITAENASQIFGKATVSFQAPTEASNSEWVLWRKSDLKEFPDMSSGDQKVCKDVTVKVNNGVYNTNSGYGVHFESLAEDGVQFVAPEGKVFKRIVILNEYGTFSDSNWSYDSNYKRWSGSADTVGFVGDICGISLIEFEVEASAPANSCGGGLTWELNNGELVISYDGEGTGVMNDYDIPNDNPAPWYANRENITSVSLPEGIKTIGKDAFRDCVNLTTVTIPNSVTTIGESAFVTVEHLETVTIGTGITSIVNGAFYGNAELTTVTCSATTPPSIGQMVFGSCTNLEHIYVPAESVDAYKTAWSDYASIISAAGGGGTPDGALSGAFTINANGDKIVFSKGNLQATTTDLGANWTWDFAPNQWSLIGDAAANNTINGNKSVSANGTVDLFGWSTAATYYGINESWNNDDYAGDFVDWGALMGTEWRTLSRAEFRYIVFDRAQAFNKQGKATVNGVSGYIFLPDAWTLPSGLSFTPSPSDYTTNQYDGANWEAMEAAGAVFLPAAGDRSGTDIYMYDYGWYWTSTSTVDDKAYYLYFYEKSRDFVEHNRYDAKSVRLVTAAPIPPYEAAIKLIDAIGTVELTAECKAKIDAARAAYDALSDGDKDLVTNIATLTQAETDYAALNQAEADKVVAKINAIPTPVTLKLATRDSIEGARAAYDALTADQKALVPAADLQKLTDAEAELATLNPGGGAPLPEGALTGAFSINADGSKIAFSKGNLQATYGGSDWTWAFAAHQYDYIGNAVANTAITGSGTVSANGTVDLFGWSTAATYYGINNTNVSGKHSGDFIDWGETIAEGWRTLTRDEWGYLFETRTDAASKYGHATVAGIHGIIVLPDSYKGTAINADHSDWSNNIISAEDWAAYEANGVAFLPAAGSRLATSVSYVGEYAFYWTSTTYGEKWAYRVRFVPDLSPDYGDRVPGQSVRLVTAHPGSATPLDSAQAVKDLIDAIPVPVSLEDACVNAVQAARDAYDVLSEAAQGALDAATVQKLNQAITDYTALIQAGADEVIAKINNIPQPVTLKLATRDSLENARAAYDALTADQQALVSNYQTLLDAEAALAEKNPGGGMPAGALSGKFSINADGDQIAFSKGNLQATTEDLGANWTWGFAANQWNYLGIAVANSKINGNGTVSENGTVDLFGWSTAATYYGINNSDKFVDYPGDFVDWGPNMGAGWRTLTKDEWNYLIENNTKGRATVNDKNGYIFLPNDWSGPAFTPDPNNFTTNVYSGDDWTAMENAGAVFLPCGPARNRNSALVAMDVKYYSSTSLNNDSSYVFTIYYNQSQSACTVTSRAYGCMVRLVTEGSVTPLDSAQVVKDLIDAIPAEITLDAACVNAVQAARDAYNALTEATKGALDAATVQKLNQAITDYTALIQAGADAVIAKINNIPQPVTLKLATRDSIESARAAYDALTADQKLLVSNYDVLEAAEATWAGLINVAPAGALSGKYTINDGGDVIYFAHGNLQYIRENLDADWSTGTFHLAENQYDLIELVKSSPNSYCTDNYGDKTAVGLFGWGTWGEGKTPNLTSSDRSLYTWSTDFSGTLEGTDTWRTLTKDEWVYLLAHNNQSYATVHGVNGLLVAPDGKDIDGKSMTDWVEINDETWTTMQNDGYLFLPACGQRSQLNSTANIITGGQGTEILYYSSTQYSDVYAHNIWYKPSQDPAADDYSNKRQAFGIRLVSAGVNPLDQAQAVKDLIDAIPVPVSLEDACVNAVQAARDAYDALSEDAQGIIDAATVQKLTDAEEVLMDLNQAEADKVVAKINNIPLPVELKLATRDSINNARAAYDALNAAQQALVTNYQTLLDAEAALAEKNQGGSASVDIVWDINTGIANVNQNTTSPAYDGITITTGNGNRFYQTTTDPIMLRFFFTGGKGSYAFAQEDGTHFTKVALISSVAMGEWLREPSRIGTDWVVSDDYKKATWIGDADTVKIWDGAGATAWVDVDSIVFTVNASSTPLDSAQAVKELIDAIPTPVEYPTSGAAIEAALNAYNELSDAAKGALDDADVQKLNDAATQYPALEAIAAIEAIPAEIVYDPAVKAAIENAREKYDALTDASKALVSAELQHKLTNAEEAWAILAAKVEHNVTYIGKEGILKQEVVALLHIPDPAPDFNGYEFVRWDIKQTELYNEGVAIKAVYAPIITTDPVAYDTLEYNGLAQELVIAGVAKEGHIEYSLYPEEPESWSANLPTATNAAAYVVYYKLVREGHEDYMAGNITVVIAKTQVSYTAPVAYDTLVYNYNMQTLIKAGITNDGIFEYTLTPGVTESWNVNLPQAQDAGTYAVYYRVIGDINHFDSTAVAPVAVTIAKRDIVVEAPVAYDTLVYNAAEQTLVIAGSADFNVMEYSLDTTVQNCWSIELPKAVTADPYTVYYRVPGDDNHNEYEAQSIAAFIAQAPLTITAEDSTIIYGDPVPEFIATYSGWQGQDDETVVSNLAFSCDYQQGSYIGTYVISPHSATAHNYAISFVNGTLTVNKAHVYVSGAEAYKAKFADGHAIADVTKQGILNGIKLNDPIAHVTTAAFSSAEVAENLDITLFYELTGDAALLNNYYLDPTSDIFTHEGVIIEPFLPDNDDAPEDEEATVEEGIEVYAYGYCDGEDYKLKYHLNSGYPNQYKIEFEDSRFANVDWTPLTTTGRDGTIDINIPVDLRTGDYTMTVTFRDSRFPWLPSEPFNVTFHVNLPETYVVVLLDNTIALIDTCHCLTDVQWYHRNDASELWQPIEGATDRYYFENGGLTGEYFVKAKMNGVDTYTCPQTDVETLYDGGKKMAVVVRAYPSPAIDRVEVSIENSDVLTHMMTIVNMMGSEIEKRMFNGNKTTLDVSGYQSGNYMISVDGNVVKVIKK